MNLAVYLRSVYISVFIISDGYEAKRGGEKEDLPSMSSLWLKLWSFMFKGRIFTDTKWYPEVTSNSKSGVMGLKYLTDIELDI